MRDQRIKIKQISEKFGFQLVFQILQISKIDPLIQLVCSEHKCKVVTDFLFELMTARIIQSFL